MGTRDLLDTVIAVLQAIPDAESTENQRWHILDAVEALQIARDECGLLVSTCSHCDAHCGDLSQP
jgi:hypothetical protein